MRGEGRIPISTVPFSSDFFRRAAAAISLRLAALSGTLGGVIVSTDCDCLCGCVGSSEDDRGLCVLLECPCPCPCPAPSRSERSPGEKELLVGLRTERGEEGDGTALAFFVSSALVGVVLCLLSVNAKAKAEGVSSLLRASTAFFPMSSPLSLLSLLSRPFSRSDGDCKYRDAELRVWSSKDASKDPEEEKPLLVSVTEAFEDDAPLDPPVSFEDRGAARGGRSIEPDRLLMGETARGIGRVMEGILSLLSPLSPELGSTTKGAITLGQGSPSTRGPLGIGLNFIFAAVPLRRSCSLFLFEARAR